MAKAKGGIALFYDNQRRKALDEQYYQKCNALKEILSSEVITRPMTEEEKRKYKC